LGDRKQQSGLRLSVRNVLIAAVLGLAVVGGTSGRKLFGRQPLVQASQAAVPLVGTTAQDVNTTRVADEEVQHLKHPAHGYVLITAYFEEHQTDADMNMDVDQAIKAAAAEVKKQKTLALVVTCHGADALVGGVNVTEEELISARLDTIKSGLVEAGVSGERIFSSWGDPSLARSAAQLGGPMESDRPTCYIETASHP
jgi:hypothetical protein